MPGRYDVVTVTGKVVEQPKFERLDQADSRLARQAKIWNLIWWRRLFYFATVAVTLWLLAFPFMGASRAADEFMSPLRWVSDIVRTLGSILPSFAAPWINGWARAPGQFLLTVLVLAAMLLYSGRLARRTGNDMAVAWRASLDNDLGKVPPPTDWLYRLRTSAAYIKAARCVAEDDRARAVCDPFRLSRADLDQSRALQRPGLCRPGLQGSRRVSSKSCGRSDEIILANRKSYMLGEKQKQDVFGTVQEELPVFHTNQLCQSMGVYLTRGARYLITFESTNSFARRRDQSRERLLFQRAGQSLAGGGDVCGHAAAA